MGIERNVGGIDRIVRAVLGVVLVAVALGAVLRGRLALAGVAVLAGASLLFNAAAQFCGVNAMLGVDTCSRE